MTLGEIAIELGVSKSTVSRALSGKGRIGEATREQIVSFVRKYKMQEEEDVLKLSKTYNIGVVLPADVYTSGSSYFYNCLLGISEAVNLLGYHVLLTTGQLNDTTEIKKLVEHEKVDGIILTRGQEFDKALKYLTDIHFPTGMTGLCNYEEVIQVDTDNEGATEKLISLLIGRGYQKYALVVEDLNFQVNKSRYKGFCNALLKNGISEKDQVFYTGTLKMEFLDSIISNMIARKVECIICGDDAICTRIMSRLQAEGYRIPKDIAIASLYNSTNLDCFSPAITAINVSAAKAGNTIGKQMIHYLTGKQYDKKTMLDYEILFRKSAI